MFLCQLNSSRVALREHYRGQYCQRQSLEPPFLKSEMMVSNSNPWFNINGFSAGLQHLWMGLLYSVDWTREWTVALDSHKVALVISNSRIQEITERHRKYTPSTIDNSLPSTPSLATQLSLCRKPALVLP